MPMTTNTRIEYPRRPLLMRGARAALTVRTTASTSASSSGLVVRLAAAAMPMAHSHHAPG